MGIVLPFSILGTADAIFFCSVGDLSVICNSLISARIFFINYKFEHGGNLAGRIAGRIFGIIFAMAQCCVVWVAGLTFGAQLFTATLPLSSPGAVRSDLLPPVSSRSRRSSRDPLRRISCSPASASRPRQRRPAARPATTPTGPPRCGCRSAGRRCPRRGVWCAVAGLVSALGARNALPRALRRPSVAKNI